MSVTCNVYLPPQVRARDVATVCSILAGNKWEWESQGRWINCEDAKVVAGSLAQLCFVEFTDVQGVRHSSGKTARYTWHFHFETDHAKGYKLLSCGSDPYTAAMARKLVSFFGGEADFDDCDYTTVDFRRAPAKDLVFSGKSGEKNWKSFQQRLSKLKPLTSDDI